jgi:hypothetical protein
MVIEDEDKERIRLAEADLAQTNDFVKGVLATGAAIRGSAITIWLALLGFAAQQHLAVLCLLAAIVTLVFLFVDGYHGWLYSEAFKHAYAVERLLSTYYNALSRADDDPEELIIFRRDLRVHRFGLFHNLPERFKLKHIFLKARPTLFYRILYPVIIVLALIFWGLLGFHVVGKDAPVPTHVIIDQVRH